MSYLPFPHRFRPYGKVVCALLLAACQQEPSMNNVASRYVKSVPVDPATGATISVSSAEHKELGGTRLLIPPGALGTKTTVTLEYGYDAILATPGEAVGPVAIWGPSG